jgi:hypothetical protein
MTLYMLGIIARRTRLRAARIFTHLNRRGLSQRPAVAQQSSIGLVTVQADGVGLLNFDGAAAAAAGDPQQMSLYLG